MSERFARAHLPLGICRSMAAALVLASGSCAPAWRALGRGLCTNSRDIEQRCVRTAKCDGAQTWVPAGAACTHVPAICAPWGIAGGCIVTKRAALRAIVHFARSRRGGAAPPDFSPVPSDWSSFWLAICTQTASAWRDGMECPRRLCFLHMYAGAEKCVQCAHSLEARGLIRHREFVVSFAIESSWSHSPSRARGLSIPVIKTRRIRR